MTGPLGLLRNTFSRSQQADAESDATPERPETTLHECETCGTVFIEHSGDACSQCGSDSFEAH